MMNYYIISSFSQKWESHNKAFVKPENAMPNQVWHDDNAVVFALPYEVVRKS